MLGLLAQLLLEHFQYLWAECVWSVQQCNIKKGV